MCLEYDDSSHPWSTIDTKIHIYRNTYIQKSDPSILTSCLQYSFQLLSLRSKLKKSAKFAPGCLQGLSSSVSTSTSKTVLHQPEDATCHPLLALWGAHPSRFWTLKFTFQVSGFEFLDLRCRLDVAGRFEGYNSGCRGKEKGLRFKVLWV